MLSFVCGTNPKLPEVEDVAVAESFPVTSSFPWWTDVDLFSAMFSVVEFLDEKNWRPQRASSHALCGKNKKKNQENNTQTWKHRRTSTERRPSKLVQFWPLSLSFIQRWERALRDRERAARTGLPSK